MREIKVKSLSTRWYFMTFDEADKIFGHWIEFVEINDKLSNIFSSIPKSFLPYPVEALEEALNIVAKNYFDQGDLKASSNIQESIASLIRYKDDEEAIENILESLSLKDPSLRKIYLGNLKKARDSWAKLKKV